MTTGKKEEFRKPTKYSFNKAVQNSLGVFVMVILLIILVITIIVIECVSIFDFSAEKRLESRNLYSKLTKKPVKPIESTKSTKRIRKSNSFRNRNPQSELATKPVKLLDSTRTTVKLRKAKRSNFFGTTTKKAIAEKAPSTKVDVIICVIAASVDDPATSNFRTDPYSKLTKHQGNAKSFKRKSKRPGRV